MESLRAGLAEIVAANAPVTVRQVYYQAVTRGLIPKTEAAYKTVSRLLAEMRLSGDVAFGDIADNTRWMRRPVTHASYKAALINTARTYRRALWDNQDSYVEVWLEKEALAGVPVEVTDDWDVPLMVTRGYSSLSYLYEAAEAIASQDRPAFIYYFGDWDPSGVDIFRNVEERLREFAPDADLAVERIAVTPEQISAFQLPTRPTKRADSRARGFKGESVEVDAIPPAQLRALAEQCILTHIDERALEVCRAAEDSERELLRHIMDREVRA